MARELGAKIADVQEPGRVGTWTGGDHQKSSEKTDSRSTHDESPYGKRTRSHERVAGSCGDEPHAIQKRLWSLRRDDGKRSAKKKTEEARAIHAGTRHSRTVCAGPRPGPIPQAQIHTHWGHDNPNVERTANG